MQKLVNGQLIDLTQEEIDAINTARETGKEARLLAALAARRYAVENGGITVNGLSVLTDDRSKLMVNGALAAAQQDAGYSTKWKTASGFVTLNASQVIAVANAVASHVAACFAAEAEVAALIADYETEAEVIAAFDAEWAN